MRKSICLLLTFILCLFLVACSGQQALSVTADKYVPEVSTSSETTEETPVLPTEESTEPVTEETTEAASEVTTEATTETAATESSDLPSEESTPLAEHNATAEPEADSTSEPSEEPTTEPTEESTTVPEASVSADYVLNKNTKKFHYPHCSSVGKMKEKNKEFFHGTREELIARGYDPCGRCHP